MTLIKWRPMVDPFDDFDRFFEDIVPSSFGRQAFVPAIDVYQDKDNVIAETLLPGVDPDDVKVSVENDVLTIEGKSEKKSEVDEKSYYRKEVRYGGFHRAVALPVAVKGSSAKASLDSGKLTVTIPKEERAKPQTVKVDVVKGKK